MGFLLSLFLGLLPMLVFAWVVYWLDRYEKEPLALLGGVFLWGAIGAATAAFVINTLFGIGVYLFTSSEAATDLATGSLIAPVVEEILKGLAVLTVFLLARSEFELVHGWHRLCRDRRPGFRSHRERLLHLQSRIFGRQLRRAALGGIRAHLPGWLAAPLLYRLFWYWIGTLPYEPECCAENIRSAGWVGSGDHVSFAA